MSLCYLNCELRQKLLKLVLDWRNVKKKKSSVDLQSKGEFPHNQHELPQKCCVCILITKLITKCAAHIVKQGFILWTGNVIGRDLGKWAYTSYVWRLISGYVNSQNTRYFSA
jgi:hypothetical protein